MPPNPIDFKKLLDWFREMYAHALTLQELLESTDGRQYRDVKPKYDQIAESGFRLFYETLDNPEAFAKAVRDFLGMHSKTQPPQQR